MGLMCQYSRCHRRSQCGCRAIASTQTNAVRYVCRDVSDVLIEQLDLYRDTREGIQAGLGGRVFADMSMAARDRALKQEMKAENNLHPALCTPDGHYKVPALPPCLLRMT